MKFLFEKITKKKKKQSKRIDVANKQPKMINDDLYEIDVDHKIDESMANKDENVEYVRNDSLDLLMCVHNLHKRTIYLDEFCIRIVVPFDELYVDEILNCSVA